MQQHAYAVVSGWQVRGLDVKAHRLDTFWDNGRVDPPDQSFTCRNSDERSYHISTDPNKRHVAKRGASGCCTHKEFSKYQRWQKYLSACSETRDTPPHPRLASVVPPWSATAQLQKCVYMQGAGIPWYSDRCGLKGPWIESWWGRNFLYSFRPARGPTYLPIQWVPRIFPEGKAVGTLR